MKTLNTLKLMSLFFAVAFMSQHLSGQERTINGRVTILDSIPLVNVEVMAMSNKQISYTDSLGRFVINCLPKDKLKVKAYGFVTRKVKVNQYTKLAFVNLKFKTGSRNPDIAVGYGHIKESDKLYAVSSLESKKNGFSNYSNMYDLIRGSLPGVNVNGKNITIRGETSVNSYPPLIVVDGVVSDSGVLDRLSPFDVKSVDVLKDGATSIYGSRGANGVIIITTKKDK